MSAGSTTTTGEFNIASITTSTAGYDFWNQPQRMEVREVGETIEMIYKEISTLSLSVYPPRPAEERVFKIVYSCIDGKWNKSERIYGKIIPAQPEFYAFEG